MDLGTWPLTGSAIDGASSKRASSWGGPPAPSTRSAVSGADAYGPHGFGVLLCYFVPGFEVRGRGRHRTTVTVRLRSYDRAPPCVARS
jgi:hypothetical protein